MAVRRQRTQVFNQPVGIVQTRAGAADVASSISNAADRIAQLAYREAAVNAKEVGERAALSQSSDRITSLNPKTNEPEAFIPPSNFGTIAARSYQNMIDRRFEESILSEFETAGKEIAETSDSALIYKERMAKYIGAMYDAEGEATPYSTFIKESGDKYVASTYANLAQKEAEDAKESLIKSQLRNLFRNEIKISQMISSGSDTQSINDSITSERARVEDLFDADGITGPQYRDYHNRLDGLQALSANIELSVLYSSMSKMDQETFKAGLQNPNLISDLSVKLEKPRLKLLTVQALNGMDASKLATGLDAYSQNMENIDDIVESQYVSQNRSKISPSMTSEEFFKITESLSAENKADFNLYYLEQVFDTEGETSPELQKLEQILLTTGPIDFNEINRLIPKDLRPTVKAVLSELSDDDRESLAKEIGERRAALSRVESTARNEEEASLRKRINNMLDDDADFNKINLENIKRIIYRSSIDSRIKDTLAGRAEVTFVTRSIREAEGIPNASLDDLEYVLNNIDSDRIDVGISKEAAQLHTLYRKAYKINPSTVTRELNTRINGVKNNTKKVIQTTRLQTIEDAIKNKISVSENDKSFYFDEKLKGQVITTNNMFEYPSIVNALNSGVMPKQAVIAMESTLNSNDEEQIKSAIQIFEQYSNLDARTDDGRVSKLDLMRQSLSPTAYAFYSALSIVARDERVEPLSIALEFRAYEGNILEDIKQDLGKSLNSKLSETPMSDNYKKEISAFIQMQKVRGNLITDDLISDLIDNYTSKMEVDESVTGLFVGDKTVYARNLFFTDDEIIKNRVLLSDTLADSGQFDELLRGGTIVDQSLFGLRAALGEDYLLRPRAIIEAFTSGVAANEELSDRARMRAGMKTLNFDLAYRPVVSAFNEGEPIYEVGYMNMAGGFMPIIINGDPFLLQKERDQDVAKAELRNARYNNFVVSTNTLAPAKDRATAEIKYLATLDHMNEELFTSGKDYNRFLSIFMDETTALEIYKEQREEYLKAGRLRITVEEFAN